uniref:Farnesoic acid O-methyl transferase domain-containing protein n=1 Tax=Megaselia scalaris TaxID=36166 RepID=T1GTY4_MEGSC
MDGVYFTEVELVINKEYGFVAVFLPNYGTSPFLKCYEPEAISKIKYIGFTGRHDTTARYIYDCPV